MHRPRAPTVAPDPNQWALWEDGDEDIVGPDRMIARSQQFWNQSQETIQSGQMELETPRPGTRGDNGVNFYGDNYQIPTSTTDPERPRTVAAKYAPDERACYVVFRPSGGDLSAPVVKYHEVSALDWQNFKRAYSKGRYIYQNWDGQFRGNTPGLGMDAPKPYERVGDDGLDSFLTTAIGYARAQQNLREGVAYNQATSSSQYKVLQRRLARGESIVDYWDRKSGGAGAKLGGTGRKRLAKQRQRENAADLFYRPPSPPRP